MPAPTDIANLYAWYKGDAGLFTDAGSTPVSVDGDAIYQWNDQSGNGRHLTQSSAGDRLLWDAVKSMAVDPYDGTNRFMNCPGSFTLDRQAYSCIVIGENSTCMLPPYGGQFRWFWTTDLGGFGQFDLLQDTGAADGSKFLAAYDGVSFPHATSTIPLTTTPCMFGWVGNASNTVGWLDGVSTSGAAMPSGTRTLTGMLGKGGDSWQAGYRDVIIYSAAISSSDITNTLFPYAQTRGVAASRQHQAIFVGDSISAGYGSTLTRNYPSLLTLASTIRRRNVSLAGRLLQAMDSTYSTYISPLYVGGETNVVVVFGGTNDVAAGASGATVYGYLNSLRTAIQGDGHKCVAVTMLPRLGWSGSTETARTTFNSSIHSNSGNFDGVVLLDSDSRTEANYLSTYSDDGIHPNDAGYAVIASLIDAVVKPLFPNTGNRRRRVICGAAA